MASDDQKIIIDEGWKAQVDREREELEREREDPQDAPEAGEEAPEDLSLFDHLVSQLAAQTMFALGLIAPDGQEEVMVDLGLAKHLVESLMMLGEKTQGNLTPPEDKNLKEATVELQRAFSARARQVHDAAQENPGIDPAAQGPPLA